MGKEPNPVYREEEMAAGKKLPAMSCTFVLGVASLAQLPPDAPMEEVAFAGRSNVGKSSLINALTGRRGLAKTSNTPGRTQQLNYFNLADRLYLVDLPGYGYAKAPESMVKQWQKMIFAYLQGRVNLKRVFLLIDSRHGIKKVDRDIMELLDKAAVTYQRSPLLNGRRKKSANMRPPIRTLSSPVRKRARVLMNCGRKYAASADCCPFKVLFFFRFLRYNGCAWQRLCLCDTRVSHT